MENVEQQLIDALKQSNEVLKDQIASLTFELGVVRGERNHYLHLLHEKAGLIKSPTTEQVAKFGVVNADAGKKSDIPIQPLRRGHKLFSQSRAEIESRLRRKPIEQAQDDSVHTVRSAGDIK